MAVSNEKKENCLMKNILVERISNQNCLLGSLRMSINRRKNQSHTFYTMKKSKIASIKMSKLFKNHVLKLDINTKLLTLLCIFHILLWSEILEIEQSNTKESGNL